MDDTQIESSQVPSLCLTTMRLWDGRLFYAMFAGGFVGLGLGTLILTYLQWRGDKAPLLVGVCILAMALVAAWLCSRPQRIRAIHAGPDGLAIEARDGTTREVPYEQLRLCVPYVESLFTLLPGRSYAVDLLIGERFLRVYLSAPMRGQLYRFLEKHAPYTAINTPSGALELPVPPDRHRSGWLRENEALIRDLYRHIRWQSLVTAGLTTMAFAVLLTLQVLAAVSLGEDAIHGMLILFIVVAGVLMGGAWWGVWGSMRDCWGYLSELYMVESSQDPEAELVAGRLHLFIETGPPDEISAKTKWASVLSVLLSCIPLLGIVLAGYALYNTWERKVVWYGIAWFGMIFSCTGSFCIGLSIVMELLGEPTVFSDF